MKLVAVSTFVASFVFVSVVAGQTTTGQSRADENTGSQFERIAVIKMLDHQRTPGARLIQLNDNKDLAAVAMYGCKTVLWDLVSDTAIGEPTRQSGDAGAIGFIPHSNLAYTADWNKMQLWNQKNALESGEGFPHELREDTVIGPAISAGHDLVRVIPDHPHGGGSGPNDHRSEPAIGEARATAGGFGAAGASAPGLGAAGSG